MLSCEVSDECACLLLIVGSSMPICAASQAAFSSAGRFLFNCPIRSRREFLQTIIALLN